MKIAVIGSGGREHAILRKLLSDDHSVELLALPGNGGTHRLARNIFCEVGQVQNLIKILENERPDLTIVGPEIPLELGLVDQCINHGIVCFGPTAAAAKLESSKAFAKELMHRANVPTARYELFTEYSNMRDYVEGHRDRDLWVVKASGLAAGKGVYLTDSMESTLAVGKQMLEENLFGDSGHTIIVEERLTGKEISCMYFCDGEDFRMLPVAQDYKRAFDGDLGPNTGGMGSFSPSPLWNSALQNVVENTIIAPVLQAMRNSGTPYRGILYAGLMLTDDGPKVIEFNCRLGDPETQSMLAIWPGNFAEYALACAHGSLGSLSEVAPVGHAVCVVLAAENYPDHYQKGIELQTVADSEQAYVLHAGTVMQGETCISTGGRVLNAVGTGQTQSDARNRAYELADKLRVTGLRYRLEIGL